MRKDILTPKQKELALANALRYFPAAQHETLAPEFAAELKAYGRIYMYRFMPTLRHARAPHRCLPGQDPSGGRHHAHDPKQPGSQPCAQHPEELITYGGNGAVFQNWAQYRLVMRYLSEMTEEQTLVMYSGHPLGLFPSHAGAPAWWSPTAWSFPTTAPPMTLERMNALGVSQYGQMTAGSYMYIGPQGIVHGTTITVLNAGRRLDPENPTLAGKLFVTAGLGGMSGAQPKAGNIAGVVSVTAEVDPVAAWKRHEQGWVDHVVEDVAELANRVRASMENKDAVSYAYLGNVVDVWEHFYEAGIHIHLGSDQTSLHNPWAGGYYPVGLPFELPKR